jgi:FtsZ-binding cell division protein ZapB
MALDKKVASLIEKKRVISKEINDLQNNCEHLNKVVKSIKENEDSSTFVVRCVCGDCEKIIGMPTQQELNTYLNGIR